MFPLLTYYFHYSLRLMLMLSCNWNTFLRTMTDRQLHFFGCMTGVVLCVVQWLVFKYGTKY
jgi:hypothetical protein